MAGIRGREGVLGRSGIESNGCTQLPNWSRRRDSLLLRDGRGGHGERKRLDERPRCSSDGDGQGRVGVIPRRDATRGEALIVDVDVMTGCSMTKWRCDVRRRLSCPAACLSVCPTALELRARARMHGFRLQAASHTPPVKLQVDFLT